ncbi:FG-GAP repeat protein [Nitrosomonas ureae]|uniref:beta strand repeat-containing protein n=1 Tax=Nitrosomonas ureae TaxID=44577 RepID=UPI000D7688C5|nr:integrin alpha [Nitrosomonas ureae]PXX16591.1 FG-GAP repeat protein [Nitrosomonas ureae]
MAIPIMNVSILNGSNGFRLDGVAKDNVSGNSVSNAGDINGDGFDDVIIGARFDGSNNTYFGSSYVVFGQAAGFDRMLDLSSLDGSNGFRLDAPYIGLYYFSGSDAGDINGDGFDDVIIGAQGADMYRTPTFDGASYVVFGRSSGFSADINLSSLDGSNGFRLDGIESQNVSVSSAGDVNGDGFDDVIVGVSGAVPNGFQSGSSYVVFGKASGFDSTMSLSSLNGDDGFRLDGVASRDNSGTSVSSAGDVNGDGFADVIIGATGVDSNADFSGSSYVVFGRASGFSAAMELSSLDGNNGFRLDGLSENDFLGKSVSNAGDINGDGFADLIIGASGVDTNASGSSYVVFGRAAGFAAAMDVSNLDGSNGFRLDGGSTVSNAGDVNGDDLDDLIVGAISGDPDGDFSGSSYVIFGKTSGFAATLNLSSLDGNDGFRLDGVAAYDQLGISVSSAGDVNSDGFDDLVIGARLADPNGDRSGSSYVIFGGDFITGEAAYRGTAGDDNLVGTILAERFEAGDGNDRMDGRGGADIFHGDGGDDTIAVADLDFQQVEGGIGTDTLELTGKGINLDLANFHDTIDGIETIDLTGSGDNTLTLTLPDLLSLSDTTNTFTVNGNAGDHVVGLLDGWTDAGFEGNYRIFANSGTTLQVDRAVHTEVSIPTTGVINLTDLDGNNGFRLDGAASGDLSGRSVSNAGDVNGDGFDDVIIGAPNTYQVGSRTDLNSSYVVFGKASGFDAELNLSSLDGNNGFRLSGVTADDLSGWSVSSAGDINGDGIDDVIIGATRGDSNGTFSGSSYVVFGKASGFAADMDLSNLDGNNGFRLDGVVAFDSSGTSVSNAGDVNGDGFDDVIVSAPYADPNGEISGSSYVVFGRASGFTATLNLANLDGSNGFRLNGEAAYDFFGWSVSNAGDVNGDGFADLIAGASGADPNGNYSGSGYVVFGKSAGFDAMLNLSNLDGNNGFRLDGATEGESAGASVSGAGDVNGDGFDDVIVGARYADPNGDGSGSSYVIFGKSAGFDTELNLSSLDGNNGFRLDGAMEDDRAGYSVSGAGDVNGDGFDDLLVGAPFADPNGYSSGSTYVVFGKASGFTATLNLANLNLNDSNGIRLDGATMDDRTGASVSGAGDVNGDGFDDLIVGAPRADPNGNDSGSSYVIFGRSSFVHNVDFPGTPGDDIFTGTKAAESFEGGDGNDRMIGRGGADSFDSGAGNDYIRILGDDFQFVDGGLGTDILGLAGSGYNLDLSNVIDNIHGIETIALYGVGDNTLTLTAQDVIDLSQETNTLKIKGDTGDRVVGLSSGWTDGGIHGNFHTYTQGEAMLLIGVDVTTDFPII